MSEVLKSFIKYVGLNITGMVVTAVAIFTDYWFIATAMGTNGLTSLSLAVPVYSILWGIGLLLGVGGGAKYAELKAAGEQAKANKFFTITVKMGVMVIVPIILAGAFLGTQISMLLGAEGQVISMTASYIRVLLLLSPGIIMYNIFEGFTRNDGSPKAAMISSVIYSVMNIVWDYIFIFVLGWGMFGAALATTFAALCALGYLLVYWLQKRSGFRLAKVQVRLRHVIPICIVGGSSFMGEFLYGFVLIAFNLTLLNLAGNVGVAAFGIVSSIAFIVTYIFFGIGQGIQPLASHYYGRQDSKNLRKVLNYSLITSAAVALIVIAGMFNFTETITAILNSEQDPILAELANEGIRIYFAAFLFAGITVIAVAFLSVTSAPKAALALSILQGGVLVVPLVFALSRLFGIWGVWLSYPISEVLLVVVSIYCLSKANKVHHESLGQSTTPNQ
ncbi:MAG: MATE family efflux transporter [Oscillospiraceae bacterium]|nr:MATE family efflux transporter [Oscillospiraceae bacterium]